MNLKNQSELMRQYLYYSVNAGINDQIATDAKLRLRSRTYGACNYDTEIS